jgi:kynurenine formamidase
MSDIVREAAARYRNWGKWGADDELGTLNYITPDVIRKSAQMVRQGVTFSLAIPFDSTGPQINQPRRFNPIHRMILTGPDFTTGAFKRPGGVGFADDMVIMALQCGTQWDALSHCFLDGRLYNGYDANLVSSEGAKKNGMEKMARHIVTRGVLLDLVRTGQMTMCRRRGGWGDYAGGDAPGLSFHTAGWIHERRIAAIATDTWGMEVRPNEIPDTYQPLHQILIPSMGLLVGEIFDLDALAEDCAKDGIHEFQFVAPPLPITGAVGSPINPLAIK